MDIKIGYNWLQDYLETKATAYQIAEKMSLCGPSFEKVVKDGADYVFEVEVTSNRPDSASVYGIAQEAAAILPRFGIDARLAPQIEKYADLSPESRPLLPLKVNLKKDNFGSRFMALVLDGVKIAKSPKIVQKRLKQAGIRPINNIVDTTNYVMVALGQPMHAFDYDKISTHALSLRESRDGEEIVTLDGFRRVLTSGLVVGEDNGKLIDLCGVMGGKLSEVDQSTKRVLLFVQTYNPVKIRQTTQATALRTEAANLYEKGLDPEKVVSGLQMAASMIKDLTGAKIASEVIDIYKDRPKEKTVKLTYEQVKKVLGVEIPKTEIKRILEALGFKVSLGVLELAARVPTWRLGDIDIPEDLIEEIARIYGYSKIAGRLPSGDLPEDQVDEIFYWIDLVKKSLSDWGLSEVYNYSLTNKELLKACEVREDAVTIMNPLTQDMTVLRTSLLPGLLENTCQNRVAGDLAFFELSKIYLPTKDKLPEEKLTLGIILYGPKFDFFYSKGVITTLFSVLKISDVAFEPISKEYFSSGAAVVAGGESLGEIGRISGQVADKFGLDGKVYWAELDFEKLGRMARRTASFKTIPRYPPVVEDISFLVDNSLPAQKVVTTVENASRLLKKVTIIDIFDGASAKDKRSLTLRLEFQSTKPLKVKDIKPEKSKILAQLVRIGAKIR